MPVLPEQTRVFRTTPVGHDAALLELTACLRLAGHAGGGGEGLFERRLPEGGGQIALTPAIYLQLRPCLDAIGLKPVLRGESWSGEGWQRVDAAP